jgi:hypothetical protein
VERKKKKNKEKEDDGGEKKKKKKKKKEDGEKKKKKKKEVAPSFEVPTILPGLSKVADLNFHAVPLVEESSESEHAPLDAELADLLLSLNLEDYSQAFMDQELTLTDLLLLPDDEVAELLPDPDPRAKLIARLHELKKPKAPEKT